MPELPEVEVIRRGAHRYLVGQRIAEVEVLHPRSIRWHLGGEADFRSRLVGEEVVGSGRRGKYLWFDLTGHDKLVIHLGMSGQLAVRDRDRTQRDHLRVRLGFTESDQQLHFIDQRTFGGMLVSPTVVGAATPLAVDRVALDPLDPLFSPERTAARIRISRREIKRVLLDQKVVSGIGNIYADEALWRTRLHWARRADSLPTRRVIALLEQAAVVLEESIAAGGTSFDSLYVNFDGVPGYFGRELNAYGRLGQPCYRCGSSIRRERFDGRSSFRCPRCQPSRTVKAESG